MPSLRTARLLAVFTLGAVLSSSPVFAEMILGDPPPAPTSLAGLPGRGPRAQDDVGGFTVNAFSREEVRSFYNTVFQASEGVPMESTADVSSCTPGTNGTVFKEAVLRRINWYRALAGVPADVIFNTANNAANQQAAVIMSANGALSHTPPSSWFCWTASGSNAANNSNIAIGTAGPDSITGYMRDHGANNAIVGHRRWLLYPQTQVMGTGDVPDNGFPAANAVWVFDANYGGPRPATRTPYVSWPPAGYAPYQVVYPRWSFSLPSANMSAAIVSMWSNGVSVAVVTGPNQTGVGENTRVWVPMGLNADDQNTVFPFNGADTVYTVMITNITAGGSTTGFTYTVTVFDPGVPGPDYAPPVVSGPSQPFVGQGNAYTFTPVTNASGYEWRATRPGDYSFLDGAEVSLANFTANTSPGYSVRDSANELIGSFSFLLAHPNPSTETLTLNQVFVPKTNGTLTIRSRLGYAADGETAHVQISTDGGVGWQDIFTQSGVGDGTGGPVEGAGGVTRSFPLNSFAGKTILLRFAYVYTPGLFYIFPQGGAPVGWFFDNITITNAEVWTVVATNSTATANFTFNPPQATNYNLNVRALMFGDYPLDWGPAKNVSAVAGSAAVITMSRPVVNGGQVQLDFSVSGSAPSFKLLQADQLGAPWTTNGSAILTTLVPGSLYRFTTPVGPATRFYRVQTP